MSINPVNTTNQSEQKYKKPGAPTCVGGILAGGMASATIETIPKLVGPKIINKLKEANNLANDEFRKAAQGADTALKNTELPSKGVKILRYSKETSDEMLEALKQDLDKQLKFIPQKIRGKVKNSEASSRFLQVKRGINAFYTFEPKKILMPAKELGLMAFHEMGHAANANLSKIGKLLQKSRRLFMLSMPIGLIALFKTKKAPDEKSTGPIDKATDFIKNNVGKLTLLSWMPILAEEAMASIKGVNFAKKVLDPSLVQKVSKANKIAYLSYLITASSISAGIALGVKVKDAIAKPQPVKQK